MLPELSIPAAGQKDRGLWGREWSRQEYEAPIKATRPLVKQITKQAAEAPNDGDVTGAQRQCAARLGIRY